MELGLGKGMLFLLSLGPTARHWRGVLMRLQGWRGERGVPGRCDSALGTFWVRLPVRVPVNPRC